MAKGLRPAHCYHWDTPAYTRTTHDPGSSFITGIPGSKMIHFEAGNNTAEFDTEMIIVPKINIMVRHNALDAARVTILKKLEKKLGITNFLLKVNVYPHHIMRENCMATGAGADRVQSGMRRSFGKPIGRAARIKRGQPVMTLRFNNSEQKMPIAKDAFECAMKKLPGDMELIVK